MNALIRFDLALDGEYGNEHDQPFRIVEGTAARTISLRLGKFGDP
jgi:hypothetical protein